MRPRRSARRAREGAAEIAPDAPARVRRILEHAAHALVVGDAATAELAAFIGREDGDAARMLSVLDSCLTTHTPSPATHTALFDQLLARGLVEEAERLLQRPEAESWQRAALDHVSGRDPSATGSALLPVRLGGRDAVPELERRLESRDLEGVTTRLDKPGNRTREWSRALVVGVELAGLPRSPGRPSTGEDALPGWCADELALDRMAGTFAAQLTWPLMEQAIKRMERNPGGSWTAPLLRALWYARRGLRSESLDLLERVPPEARGAYAAPCVEVAARPLWIHRMGIAVSHEETARARSLLAGWSVPRSWSAYVEALHSGTLTERRERSDQLHLDLPGSPAAILALAYTSLETHDPSVVRRTLSRCRASVRYHFAGNWLLGELDSIDPNGSAPAR